jgi:ABC-type antimicrobial peptide transport system permease subunit
MERIRDKDEDYWNQYRGTPKAFISLESGQKIWGNAFGKYTSFACHTDSTYLAKLSQQLAEKTAPAGNGFIIQDVRSAGLRSASLSTDFGELFLSLGFFIVVAGLLLVALIFSLHLSKRGLETAILSTLGISGKLILRLYLLELGVLAITGSLAGSLLGIFYNQLMILGLNTIWMGAVGPTSLAPHISLQSLVLGFTINVVISAVTMYSIVYRRLKVSPILLIKGNNTFVAIDTKFSGKWQKIMLTVFALLFLVLVLYILMSRSQGFLLPLACGGLLLLVLLLFVSRLITKSGVSNGSISVIYQLVLKQWSGHKSRTITTLALLALGTFTIFITGSQQRSSIEGNNLPGTGGFLLWAETTMPIQEDLNATDGRQKNGLADEPLLDSVRFMQLPVVEGDDASCLNLNAVATPTLLGVVPSEFQKRQSLEFVSVTKDITPSEAWMELSKDSGTYIPVIADQTVITWSLLKKTGDTLEFKSETGEPLHLILKAGLGNSIFQGNILMDEKVLKKYYPSRYRSKLLLIDGPSETLDTLASRLNYLLGDKGISLAGTNERMAAFNAVQNTYLSIFMLLGGLAVIISVAGLGIILLKNIHERKQELAVMQAIGFYKTLLIRMIVSEHLSLLFCGIVIGLLCSFSTLLLMGKSTMIRMPWGDVLSIMALILLAGTAWIALPAYRMLKKNLIHSLRNE